MKPPCSVSARILAPSLLCGTVCQICGLAILLPSDVETLARSTIFHSRLTRVRLFPWCQGLLDFHGLGHSAIARGWTVRESHRPCERQRACIPGSVPESRSHIYAVHPVSDSISCDIERRATLLGQCHSDKSPHEYKHWNADSFYRRPASLGCYEPNGDYPIFVFL